MEKYELVHRLGQGASGVTYKVRNRNTRELFAMKCLHRGRFVNQDVKMEIMNHRVLSHPNVVQFKEVVLDATNLGIVMEYVDGGELFDEVRLNGAFSEAKARKFFQQLVAGISYIHFKRISHRGLKLVNTLLTSDGGLKICDFGLSKSSSLIDLRANTKVETPEYRAPEVQSDPKSYDGKLADIWSCGMILYLMLTRNFPNHNNTDQCINSLHVSGEGKDLLRRILVVNPAKRITVEEIKKHSWYLVDLPPDLTEEAQAIFRNPENVTMPCQSEEEINKLVNEATTCPVQEK